MMDKKSNSKSEIINKRANSKDVAKLAGVSQSCISKYLNNKPYVSIETRKKIEQAIEQLGFSPNAIARSLITKKTNNIGLVILDTNNLIYSETVKSIEKALKNKKFNLLLVDVNKKHVLVDDYIKLLFEKGVDGIIATTAEISPKCFSFLKRMNTPIILVHECLENKNLGISCVTVDNYYGGYIITNYLIESGHKNIAYITGILDTKSLLDRFSGYKKALEDSGLNFDRNIIELCPNENAKDGYKAAKKILSKANKPSAIFCFNDYSAYGVIDYCIENKIKIPEDISIVGFDDIEFSGLGFINLTTVRQPIEKITECAIKILSNEIEGNLKTASIIKLKPELIIRNSVKKIIK